MLQVFNFAGGGALHAFVTLSTATRCFCHRGRSREGAPRAQSRLLILDPGSWILKYQSELLDGALKEDYWSFVEPLSRVSQS